MSELANRIRKALRTESQPLGFGAAARRPEPTMVVLAVARNGDEAAAAVQAGAAAVLFEGSDVASLASACEKAGGVPCGARVQGADRRAAEAAKAAGIDFLVIDAERTAAAALLDEKLGFALDVTGELSDAQLRTLEAMNLDAIWVGPVDGPLTVRRLMELRRVSGMARKPLAASVPADVSSDDLEALRGAGVAVVGVRASSREDVEKLRKAVEALPPRARAKAEERPMPLVPRAAAVGEEEIDEDEEEGSRRGHIEV